jgi:chemotaxis protein MotB
MRTRYYFATFWVIILCSGCVSKKDYLATVSRYESLSDSLRMDAARWQGMLNTCNLELARSSGANTALLTTQDKLQQRITGLQADIDSLNRRMAFNRSDLLDQIAAKEREIAAFQSKNAAIKQYLADRQLALQNLGNVIRDSLRIFPANRTTVEVKANQLIIALNDDLLFAENATARIERDGQRALKLLAAILSQHPAYIVQVIGHTDNLQPARRTTDNWDFSVLRAATVAKSLINDYNLESNRITASGQGPYAPRTSNETAEGRLQNRRLELVVAYRDADLLRGIERLLQ